MKSFKKDLLAKKPIRVIWVIYAVFSLILVFFLADNLLTKELDNTSAKIELDDKWNISINNDSYENVNLKEFRFSPVNKGDKIVMTNILPKEWDFVETALCIHIRQTTVNMFVDDELVYEYGNDRYELGKTVGSGLQLINFSNDNQGKEIRIELQVTEDMAFSKFDSIWLSEWGNSYRFIVTENRLPLFLGMFLVVFGVVITLFSIFAVTISRKYTNILWLALFSVCMGLWTLAYHNSFLIFSIPLYSISLLEYMSLFCAPLPIIAYMGSYVKQLNSKILLLIYRILFGVQFILSVVAIYLHTTDIMHSAALLIYFQILFAIHAFFFVYVLSKSKDKGKRIGKFYTVGRFSVVITVVYDLLYYCIHRYVGIEIFEIKGISSLGILMFMEILILDFYYDITLKMMEEQEKEILIKRAYTDDLTQINNRRFCSEYMDKLQSDDTSIYTMISFDLNGLKKANDTFGHIRGDNLIKEAARVISETFSSNGIVARTGGDEFIAILKTNDSAIIDKLIKDFNNNIGESHKVNPELELSISYGYATCDEITEKNIEKVYQLADDRMYECKNKLKHA